MPILTLHPDVLAVAFIQSTQLNLFERFLTQAVTGIDSTSITSGMQNVAYVVLLVGFLWSVYQSLLHGGDVRGLGTSLIRYVATAVVVMNYSSVFTTVNQGFVNAGNWINNASGAGNLFENWANDLQTQFNQIGFQQMWGLVTGSVAGLIDAILILIAYILYPVVIVIFGFFYIFYGSVLYIFGPIVIALMPLGAGNRIAKSYVENVFIWNAWPILYGGFGALLSAVQMGQVGQMLNQNDFLGGLGNLEGSFLIGIASIIFSLAIAVIPFIAKRIVSGDIGGSATALLGAAATALTAGVAAFEGAAAGVAGVGAGGGYGIPGGGTSGVASASTQTGGSQGPGNQPASPQRPQSATSQGAGQGAAQGPGLGGSDKAPDSVADSPFSGSASQFGTEPTAEGHAAAIRKHFSEVMSPQAGTVGDYGVDSSEAPDESHSGVSTNGSSTSSRSRTPSGRGPSTQSASSSIARRHGLATWGAYHAARIATTGIAGGAASVGKATKGISNAIASSLRPAGGELADPS